MPLKNLLDFSIYDYFNTHKPNSKGVPIFDQYEEKEPQAKSDSNISVDPSIRDSMLKSSAKNNSTLWSHHPFIKPNCSTTIRKYRSPMGEWTIQTKVGTFNSSDDFASEFFSSSLESSFFGSNLASDFFETGPSSDIFGSGSSSDSDFIFKSGPRSDIFGSASSSDSDFIFKSGPISDFFESNLSSDFFGSGSDSHVIEPDFYSDKNIFPFSNNGPGSLFGQMFNMMRQFQSFASSIDQITTIKPPDS